MGQTLNRRGFLSGLAALVLASSPLRRLAEPAEKSFCLDAPNYYQEVVDFYLQKRLPERTVSKPITVLYPGSGFDATPLHIGRGLLQHPNISEVNFIYTEIGDFQENLPVFHEGLKDLDSRLQEGIRKVFPDCSEIRIESEPVENHPWKRADIPSAVIKYEILLPENKKINLTLGYNTFENRQELSAVEKQTISPKLQKEAREVYWPSKTESGQMKKKKQNFLL